MSRSSALASPASAKARSMRSNSTVITEARRMMLRSAALVLSTPPKSETCAAMRSLAPAHPRRPAIDTVQQDAAVGNAASTLLALTNRRAIGGRVDCRIHLVQLRGKWVVVLVFTYLR